VPNNNDMLDGLNDLLKNVDLEQFTSLISNLNEKGAMDSKYDLSSLNSLISNIDLEEMRSLLSGLNFDYLKDFGLLNSKFDSQKTSGLFNIEELETALYEITSRMQNFNKSE
jgi:hypothetical protein